MGIFLEALQALVSWVAIDPPSRILAALAGIATWCIWPRRPHTPIDPDYVAWLEAKAELYERALRFYAAPESYKEVQGDYAVIADGGTIANQVLNNPDFTPQ